MISFDLTTSNYFSKQESYATFELLQSSFKVTRIFINTLQDVRFLFHTPGIVVSALLIVSLGLYSPDYHFWNHIFLWNLLHLYYSSIILQPRTVPQLLMYVHQLVGKSDVAAGHCRCLGFPNLVLNRFESVEQTLALIHDKLPTLIQLGR